MKILKRIKEKIVGRGEPDVGHGGRGGQANESRINQGNREYSTFTPNTTYRPADAQDNDNRSVDTTSRGRGHRKTRVTTHHNEPKTLRGTGVVADKGDKTHDSGS